MQPSAPTEVDETVLPALEHGTTLLGSGGGGQTTLGVSWVRRGLAEHGPVRLWQYSDLPPDAPVIPVAVVGATPAFEEKLPSGDEFSAAVEVLTRATPAAVLPMEVGGINGVAVFAAAVSLGVGVVDADLMGRALPRLDQLSLIATGGLATPMALVGGGGMRGLLDGVDAEGLERLVRAMLAEAGGWAVAAFGPLPAGQLGHTSITGSVSYAIELGRRWCDGDYAGDVLATGGVTEVVRHATRRGFRQGSVTVVDHDDGGLLRLEMENEYLLAMRDGQVLATTPDPLCVVDLRTGQPIPCDQVHRGRDVACLRLPGFEFWWRGDYVDRVGPGSFGLDHAPVRYSGSVPRC